MEAGGVDDDAVVEEGILDMVAVEPEEFEIDNCVNKIKSEYST